MTSDFQGIPKGMSDLAFERSSKVRLGCRQIMLTFSHNHCGPRLGDDLVDYYPVEAEQVELVNEYTALMVIRLVAMVGDALSKLAPANLAIGEGRATFAVNRRNNREADVPSLMEKGTPLVGPVDHSVPVLTVTRPGGRLEAVLFGYDCHPTTLSFLTWCGDYPDFARSSWNSLIRAHGVFVRYLRRRSEPPAPPRRGTLPTIRSHAGGRRGSADGRSSHFRRACGPHSNMSNYRIWRSWRRSCRSLRRQ